jgi:hypothetical protein
MSMVGKKTVFRLWLGALVTAFSAEAASAQPARIIILRHGEKQDTYQLCDIGQQRALALRAQYLGKGAERSLFQDGQAPAAFFAITLHTLELIAPVASSWGLPVTDYAEVPQPSTGDKAKDRAAVDTWRDQLTQTAVRDLMTDPRWDGKVVVLAWEHDHIAHKSAPDEDTLYGLLKLGRIPGDPVPKTWPGSNYDYFWILDYKPGSTCPCDLLRKNRYSTGVLPVFRPMTGTRPSPCRRVASASIEGSMGS